ncbi:MAG: UvrD-helicase domain-containing protein [Gemmatimonadales bacterium]|nr:UvrD-helicase domain-containing protein [Gemmatimonadales bacterium]
MTPDRAPLIGLEGLNPPQREAVEHVHGPLLVVAGAGSGKTRVLTMRIARLIDQAGVAPTRIFAVTFTNKAAGEMKERVGRQLGQDPSGLWIGTFHSLSARLLRREAEALGFTRQFTIYDEDDRLSLIKRLMEQRGHSSKLFPPKLIQGLISAAKNRMTSPDDLAASPFDRPAQVAADVYRALGAALKAQNAMDFDDLMLHPLTLFRERPDRLRYYQERFAFLLVDEFQDTNSAQYQLVRLLGAHGNVCAVGDDDQSIYGWRGADVRNMQSFLTDFSGSRVVRLEDNYRSTQVVLDAANAVIEENKGRIGKTLRTRRKGGEKVTVVAAADERDEAEWIVSELRTRAGKGDWAYPEMAVLYRTNSQSRALEESFRRAGIPYRIIGAISFYDRREVKDLLAYLRLIANPADDEAFLRAIAVPRRGLGESSLAVLAEAAVRWEKPLLSAAGAAEMVQGLRPNVRGALGGFAELITGLRETTATWSPAQVLEQVITAINYEQVLLAEGPEGMDRWENVRELVASAAEWSEVVEPAEDDPTTPLERFLSEAALLSSHDSIQGPNEGVTLMTLHTAKGLEWPVVVLSGLEDGLFPLARAEEQENGLEEERRLCYVGITRAKDKLYVSWARARRRGGQLMPGRPSRFLTALPPGVVEEKRTSSMWAPSWSAGATPRRPGAPAGGGPGRRDAFFDEDVSPGRPAAEEPEVSQDAPRYVKGERVRHRRFGSGTIQGLTGTGRDLKVSVKFDDEEHGVKQLLVAYAGLEREWESA